MRVWLGIKHMLDSRGLAKGFYRLSLILKRFGWTADRQVKGIGLYAAILKRQGIRGTFFIPGVVLEKYWKDIRRIDTGSVEWGIHGDVHTDFSKLISSDQRAHTRNAVRLFDDQGLKFFGFRAPYLKINEGALDAIAAQGRFKYDSSYPVLWDEVYGKDEKFSGFIRDFYRPSQSSSSRALPRMEKTLVEIPVSLPDDDILVDRERLPPGRVLEIWTKILMKSHEKGEVFVLQLHPERIFELGETLESLIERAKAMDPPVWIAPLGEVAGWASQGGCEGRWPAGARSAFSVTGDIDSITLFDFVDRVRKW